MTDRQTGGPAFPTGIVTDDKGMIVGGGFGMTLRDYFAAKAMQALIAAEAGELHYQHGATDAYAYADAMLKARDGNP